MSSKRFFMLAVLAVLALGLGLVGCDSDDDENAVGLTTSTDGYYANVNGWIQSGPGGLMKVTAAGDPAIAIINVSSIPSVPRVSVNGTTLGIEPELTVYGGGMAFYGAVTSNDDDSLIMNVKFTDIAGDSAAAYARIAMVDTFSITSGDGGDMDLVYGDSLLITWNASSSATEYWYAGYFECDYTDTADEATYYEWQFSNTTTDTFIVFSADEIFGDMDDIDSVRYMYADFDVYGVSGPSLSGGPGNVTGDGMGVVLSVTHGGDLDFDYVEAPDKVSPVGNSKVDQADFETLFHEKLTDLVK